MPDRYAAPDRDQWVVALHAATHKLTTTAALSLDPREHEYCKKLR